MIYFSNTWVLLVRSLVVGMDLAGQCEILRFLGFQVTLDLRKTIIEVASIRKERFDDSNSTREHTNGSIPINGSIPTTGSLVMERYSSR